MTVVDLDAMRPQECSADEANALAGKVMAAAGDVARQEALFLALLGEFDATDAVRYWSGLNCTSEWLAWACSIAPSTAREHVRVARALRRMPHTAAEFAAGRLTYSKVRALTRLVDDIGGPGPSSGASAEAVHSEPMDPTVDPTIDPTIDPTTEPAGTPSASPFATSAPPNEEQVVDFARLTTASQLARTIAGYRAADGTARRRRTKQNVTWTTDEDGTVRLTAVLPPEEGAAVIRAIQAGIDANTVPDPAPSETFPDDRQSGQSGDDVRREAQARTRVEALVEVAETYLRSLPEDRSGEDRTMVVIEVSASVLESQTGAHPRDHHDGGPQPDAPAGAFGEKCRVRGGSAVEPATARRALCDAPVVGMIIDDLGEPLAVGRTERLVTRAQRRALMSRDGCCQFPGCTRTRRLKAHHRISWLDGGPTDLANLILLCQTHHTRVHEEHLTIAECAQQSCPIRWEFVRPDGTPLVPLVAGQDERSPWRPLEDDHGRPLIGAARDAARRRNEENDAAHVARMAALEEQQELLRRRYGHIGHSRHPEATDVFPVGGGEGFSLTECVDALFRMTERRTAPAA